MAEFINTIDVLGDDVVFDSIIDRTITEFKDNSVETVGKYAFTKCNALVTVLLPNVKSIGVYAFNNCTNLTAVIIRYDGVCTLHNADAFGNSAVAKGTGYVYVPKEHLDSYKAATNWSSYADQIRAIEDYPDICGG